MKFRISNGLYKGCILKFPDFDFVRPTKSVVRESLFEILGDCFESFSFLDLYSGSGMLGIEALSRGFASCVFVEENDHCVSLLKKHLKMLGAYQKSYVFNGKVELFCRRNIHRQFDIVYLSPPYRFINRNWLKRILLSLPIHSKSHIFVEHRSTKKSLLQSMVHFKMYRYGSTYLTLFRYEDLELFRKEMLND